MDYGLFSCYHHECIVLIQVEKIEAPYDKEKDQRRNFVFVEFDSEETVNKVLNHTTENPEYVHKIGSDEVRVMWPILAFIGNIFLIKCIIKSFSYFSSCLNGFKW